MIGADTNVLLRMFVDDDARQAPAARELIASEERQADPIVVTPVALAEIEWSLRRNFARSKQDILGVFDQITSNTGFVVDDKEAVDAAIDAWRSGRADFADYLIGALARERGARTTMTFDRKASETDAFTLLPSLS